MQAVWFSSMAYLIHVKSRICFIRKIDAGCLVFFHGIPYSCEIKNMLKCFAESGPLSTISKKCVHLVVKLFHFNYYYKVTTVNTLHRQ